MSNVLPRHKTNLQAKSKQNIMQKAYPKRSTLHQHILVLLAYSKLQTSDDTVLNIFQNKCDVLHLCEWFCNWCELLRKNVSESVCKQP